MKATVQRALENIQKRKGILNPKDVVDEARNPKSPLHSCFEWNDSKAAERYRLEQARELIMKVTVIRPDNYGQAVTVRAYQSLPGDRTNGGGYRHVDAVLGNEEMRRDMLRQALRDLRSFRNKYAALKSLAPLMTKIDTYLEKHSPAQEARC